jgi:hypothetical protein
VGGQHHVPAALPPGNTRYPLYRWLGGPQGRSGRVRKISPPPGFDPRTVQPVASRYPRYPRLLHEKCNNVDNLNFHPDVLNCMLNTASTKYISVYLNIKFSANFYLYLLKWSVFILIHVYLGRLPKYKRGHVL